MGRASASDRINDITDARLLKFVVLCKEYDQKVKTAFVKDGAALLSATESESSAAESPKKSKSAIIIKNKIIY